MKVEAHLKGTGDEPTHYAIYVQGPGSEPAGVRIGALDPDAPPRFSCALLEAMDNDERSVQDMQQVLGYMNDAIAILSAYRELVASATGYDNDEEPF